MTSFPVNGFEELLTAFTGQPSTLPPPDPEAQREFLEEYLRAGAPEFPYLYRACLIALRALSLLMKGRPFSRLEAREKEEFLDRLLSSRNPFLRGVALLAGMPLHMSYYRRPEVSIPLGFDPQSLREEADLRVVTRDRPLPPREEGES